MTRERKFMKRREFIKKTVIGTAGITIGGMGFSAKSYASIMGANDPEADTMLTRVYRTPYVVPNQV